MTATRLAHMRRRGTRGGKAHRSSLVLRKAARDYLHAARTKAAGVDNGASVISAIVRKAAFVYLRNASAGDGATNLHTQAQQEGPHITQLPSMV